LDIEGDRSEPNLDVRLRFECGDAGWEATSGDKYLNRRRRRDLVAGWNIVFVSAVYPDCKDDACNKQRDEEIKNSKVKAKIFTKLFYRHDGGALVQRMEEQRKVSQILAALVRGQI